jgi:osmotically-inducible protein OsmY
MADRYPQFPERYSGNDYDRHRDRPHHDDRGVMDRAGDEVRSWLGDDDAERRRRIDQQERERWHSEDIRRRSQPSGDRWSGPEAHWTQTRGYGENRPYGDGEYGWRGNTATDNQRYTGRPQGYERDRFGTSVDPDRYGTSVDRDRFAGRDRDTYGTGTFSPAERWRSNGPHAGRGPRGYQRADDRIHEEINDRLTAHGLIDATDIECRVQAGEVTLTGWVDSRAAKRAAEDVAEDVHGVREVHNQLRIRSHASDEGVGRTSVLGLTETQLQSGPEARGTAETKPKR